jgi:cytochrome c biogenesis protein CcmG/thiol:disulfide interchange protein DsbE
VRTAAFIAAFTLALTSCAGRSGEPQELAGEEVALPENRLALPEYDLARYEALIDELRGTPVVVNFWGSWCPPCRGEAPELARSAREFEGEVQFLGVDILDHRQPARDFILEFRWEYPSIFDPRAEIRDGLGYVGQPITLIYDTTGELAFEWVGPVNADLLRREIRKVL